MKNYTTQTAALKATTVDTRLLDAKQIDTKKLFINGTQFDPSQIKESPNEALFGMIVAPSTAEENGFYTIASLKLDQNGGNIVVAEGQLLKGSQAQGLLPNGVYAVINIDDNFINYICGNNSDSALEQVACIIPSSKFILANLQNVIKFEQCILENFLILGHGGFSWCIKICEEDDNLSELYGGVTEDSPQFLFFISIPYYIPENDTSSSSTYSLRKTNLFDNLREKIEQMRQQSLDKSAE